MREVVIIDAKRTAVGSFLGALANVSAVDLATTVIQGMLNDYPQLAIDEVVMGQVLQAGCGQNPARQAMIKAGIEQSIPATTINKVCGSGMKSIHYAYLAIATGEADVVLAGGMESMSQAPHLLTKSRGGYKLGDTSLEDVILKDGLTCALSHQIHMGITAENIVEKYRISKMQQDEFALASQVKASEAQKKGRFDEQIVDVNIVQRKKDPIIFNKDEFIRHDASIESIQKVPAAFKKEGSVSAANASGINDGAAVLIVMSADKAKALNLKPLAKIKGFGIAGVDPTIMGIGPVNASKKCLQRMSWTVDDLDLIESNEAFAAQSIAVNKELGWDVSKVNVNGGAIAIGHPIGASGTRIVTTLLHEMRYAGKAKGLATMCIGGGMGIASAYELMD